MATPDWGPGWPNCDSSHIGTLVRSDGLRLPIQKDLHPMVSFLMNETERRGYDILPGETWGYACRPIRDSHPPRKSNHSDGTAIDINAPSNPMGAVLRTDMPTWMHVLWESFMWRWGGSYTGRKDAMHYEFMGTRADAARLTASISGPKPPLVVSAKLPIYQANKAKGIPMEQGPLIEDIQKSLNEWIWIHKPKGVKGIPVNGKYDDVTAITLAAFKMWVISIQKAFGLPQWPNHNTTIGPVTMSGLDYWNAH